MKKIVILGATGSIGTSTLDIVRAHPEEFTLLGFSGHTKTEHIKKLINEFRPRYVCLRQKTEWTSSYPQVEFLYGQEGLDTLATLPEADIVVMALSGLSGLSPTIQAILSKKRLLSANKEAIVAAGPIINHYLNATHSQIIPLDSEHNAIFTLLERFPRSAVEHIVLTASGGPFFHSKPTKTTSRADVLRHPTWSMGNYITVNSATMLNKGFEVIEAHYLFHLPFDKIRVLVHPQSLVHGMVRLTEGTEIMVASPSDMRYPITLALFHPEIPSVPRQPFTLAGQNLEFHEVPCERFPLLWLAYQIGTRGGLYPLALNAINEEIVEAFLQEKISFIDIESLIQRGIELFDREEESRLPLSLESLSPAEQKARSIARTLLARCVQ